MSTADAIKGRTEIAHRAYSLARFVQAKVMDLENDMIMLQVGAENIRDLAIENEALREERDLLREKLIEWEQSWAGFGLQEDNP